MYVLIHMYICIYTCICPAFECIFRLHLRAYFLPSMNIKYTQGYETTYIHMYVYTNVFRELSFRILKINVRVCMYVCGEIYMRMYVHIYTHEVLENQNPHYIQKPCCHQHYFYTPQMLI